MDLELASFDEIARELSNRSSCMAVIVAIPCSEDGYKWTERFRYSGDLVTLLGFLEVLRHNVLTEKESKTEPTENV